MGIARIRQWLCDTPLPIEPELKDRIESYLENIENSEIYVWFGVLLLSREGKIQRAINHAHEISEEGEVHYQSSTHMGYTRVWVYTKKHFQYRLDFYNQVHFREDPPSERPAFGDKGKIKFRARGTPLPYSNPRKTASYLEVEYVR